MLQDFRKHTQGAPAKIFIGLIVLSFAFFGIESILLKGGQSKVAEVNGEAVSPQALQTALENQKRRLIAMMGDKIDPSMLEDDKLRPQALETLIGRQLLMQSAKAMKLEISNAEIGKVVAGMEQFQVDGVFSPEAYKNVLAHAGYTPASFKESLREDIVLNQMRSGLGGSDFVTPTELNVNARIMAEQRDLRYVTIPREKFNAKPSFSEEQISAYYHAHEDLYRTPESVDIDYLELSLDNYRKPVEESAIAEAYELAKQDSQYQTQNRVSHILFQDDGNVAERIAQAQAELAAGKSFSEVAKKFSDDKGSSAKGGDLGFSSGQTFPEAMETVIKSLEPGVVSAPIKTEAGTHLVLVTDRKQGDKPTLEAMRPQLVENLQADAARAELLRNVETLKDLSFNAEDLSYPAKELGVQIKQANAITRSTNEGLFANKALLDAAFSDEILASGLNSEVIELKGDQFVVLRVKKRNEAELKPLEAVKTEVVAALTNDATRAAVADSATKVLAQLNNGAELEKIASAEKYELKSELGVTHNSHTLPPLILQRVFALPAPAAGHATKDYLAMPNGDAVVIELLQVKAGDFKTLPQTEQLQLQQLLSGEVGTLIDSEFQNGLRKSAKITVL
jgi:peptidyl-prolyl cis-trans isomerase D